MPELDRDKELPLFRKAPIKRCGRVEVKLGIMPDPLFELEWTELSKADYDALDGSQKMFVDEGLDRIQQRGMQAGEPLRGNLAGCNKLENNKLGLHIVFRQSAKGIQIIQIVAIGKRSDFEVYEQSGRRL